MDVPHATFNSITVSGMCTTPYEHYDAAEAFTTLDVMCPDRLGKHYLKVKVDTGASANTLPTRTMKQICGDQWRSIATPTSAKLTVYNGSDIKWLPVHNVQIPGVRLVP